VKLPSRDDPVSSALQFDADQIVGEIGQGPPRAPEIESVGDGQRRRARHGGMDLDKCELKE